MNKDILRVLEELEKMGWITINDQLNREAVAQVFAQKLIKDMTVGRFIEVFSPTI